MLQQAGALRAKLALDASAAAAAAEADLAAKQRTVAAAHAAAAPGKDSSSSDNGGGQSVGALSDQQPCRTASCSNCMAPGYWPDSMAAAAEISQSLKQQQHRAAAEAVELLRRQQADAGESVLQQQTAAKAAAQAEAQLQSQVRLLQLPARIGGPLQHVAQFMPDTHSVCTLCCADGVFCCFSVYQAPGVLLSHVSAAALTA